MSVGEPVLCFVKGEWAYFTTQKLEDQWGDDWGDFPYEHNAGTPYGWSAARDGRGCQCVHPQGFLCFSGQAVCGKPGHVPKTPVPEWQIIRVVWSGPFDTPSEGHSNSPFSVRDINRGDVAWLRPSRWETAPTARPIPAGTPLFDFVFRICRAGGAVYLDPLDGRIDLANLVGWELAMRADPASAGPFSDWLADRGKGELAALLSG